jgi:hypothetical protein
MLTTTKILLPENGRDAKARLISPFILLNLLTVQLTLFPRATLA